MIRLNDLLEDMLTFYVTNGVAQDGSIFRDTMPDSPNDAIALYEYNMVPGLPQVAGSTRYAQVVSRSPSATVAKLKARELYQLLESEEGIINLTTDRWCMVIPSQGVIKLKVDDNHRTYYSFNVVITTYND